MRCITALIMGWRHFTLGLVLCLPGNSYGRCISIPVNRIEVPNRNTPDETQEEHHFLTLRSPVRTMKSVLHISFLPHFLLAEEATAPNSSSDSYFLGVCKQHSDPFPA